MTGIKPQRRKNFHLQVKWEVMKRKDVPKKTKATPTAPLVLIWEMILVVTVACSTSVQVKDNVGIIDTILNVMVLLIFSCRKLFK